VIAKASENNRDERSTGENGKVAPANLGRRLPARSQAVDVAKKRRGGIAAAASVLETRWSRRRERP
jgi:hypothetical protein